MVMPALNEDVKEDPVFFFAGGPGQGATQVGIFVMRLLGPERQRDIVLIDQRGTGKSNQLPCDVGGDTLASWMFDFQPPQMVRDCLEDLKDKADLSMYTTNIAMDDINEVRAALGYDKINLMGGSYGTRAAQVFMKRHPEQVRTAILMGVSLLSDPIPDKFAEHMQRSLDILLDECAADPKCNGAYPDLRAKLNKIKKQLQTKPVEVSLKNSETGQIETVKLEWGSFINAFRSRLYVSGRAIDIPRIIHKCASGDWKDMAREAINYSKGMTNLPMGMYLAVTCSEDIPYIKEKAALKGSEGTVLGDYRLRQQIDACKLWKGGPMGDDWRGSFTRDIPVLMLSGEVDPVTPPSSAEATRKWFPNSKHIVVAGEAHSLFNRFEDCLRAPSRKFLNQASIKGIEAPCAEEDKSPGWTYD